MFILFKIYENGGDSGGILVIVIATVILPLANLSFLQIFCLSYLKFTKTEATVVASWSAIVIATVILPLANLSLFTNLLFILFKIHENGGDKPSPAAETDLGSAADPPWGPEGGLVG